MPPVDSFGNPPQIAVAPNASVEKQRTTRRSFISGAVQKALYVAPVVTVLGTASEALANSKDGIAWSQCGSFGEPCQGGACCPGFMCVSVGQPMCQPG